MKELSQAAKLFILGVEMSFIWAWAYLRWRKAGLSDDEAGKRVLETMLMTVKETQVKSNWQAAMAARDSA